MDDELVKALRETDFGDTCVLCEHKDMCKGNDCIIIQAADAIEKLQKRVPKRLHGRLIDADEFLKRAIGTKCFRGDYALMLEELVGESTTIIPAEEGET